MKKIKTGKLIRFWKFFGPGLITGAADDDPSAIATYSIAGAKTGQAGLWTMIYSLPLMIVLQEMSARIGISSSCGLAGNLKRHYSKYLLAIIAAVIVFSNIFNIGADVSGMAAAVELLIPRSSSFTAPILILLILFLTVVLPYRKISTIFKWLSLSLVIYILAGFLAVHNWVSVLFHAFAPTIKLTKEYGVVLLALLGTTISPYLAVWQASEEAEEQKLKHGITQNICRFRTVTKNELKHVHEDTFGGMLFSNIIGLFIIALTSSVLFQAGMRNIETVKEAAQALQPLAGSYAYLLFTIGLISSGLLAIPVLAGAAAYVVAEIFGWQASLDKPFSKAKEFYLVIVFSALTGLAMNYVGLSPIKALFYTAILQGLAGPILIGALLHMANNPAIVGPNVNSKTANILAYSTMLLMIAASVIFFTTF